MQRHVRTVLNAILPMFLRHLLKRFAMLFIPSLRHLDMRFRLECLQRLGFEPSVILDVGMARGDWTKLAADIWPDARIHGFEPNSAWHSQLESLCAQSKQLSFSKCFLGAESKEAHYVDRGTQTSLYYQRQEGQDLQIADVMTLDDLVTGCAVPQPDFIKMDVQGNELNVIKGAHKTLSNCEAALMEVSFLEFLPGVPLVSDIVIAMGEEGFAWYDVAGILRRSADDALFQMDVLFVRTDSPLGMRSREMLEPDVNQHRNVRF